MKVVYSYYGNKPSEFLLKMGKLSLSTLNQFSNYESLLYTDSKNYDYFKSLKFNNIIIKDFDVYKFMEKGFWNASKLFTYADQELPFLHVDFDTAFTQEFIIPEAQIITEKLREVLLEHRQLSISEPIDKMICSGFIGGCDYGTLFKEHLEWAIKIMTDNENKPTYETLNSIEEYTLTQRILQHNLKISRLAEGSYLHFWCEPFKSKEKVHGQIVNSLFDVFNL